MTQCSQESLAFAQHFSRQVVAQFDGAWMTSDGGGLLLRQTARKIGLLERVVAGFTDTRDPARVQHPLAEMLAQRIYGLALGYEDFNDHEELRRDPLLALPRGVDGLVRSPPGGLPVLAGAQRTAAGGNRRHGRGQERQA